MINSLLLIPLSFWKIPLKSDFLPVSGLSANSEMAVRAAISATPCFSSACIVPSTSQWAQSFLFLYAFLDFLWILMTSRSQFQADLKPPYLASSPSPPHRSQSLPSRTFHCLTHSLNANRYLSYPLFLSFNLSLLAIIWKSLVSAIAIITVTSP